MSEQNMTVFLSGHVHGDWRGTVKRMAEERGLPITFKGPCENHQLSDEIGANIRGLDSSDVGDSFFPKVQDDLGGRFNNLRNRIWIKKSDLLIAFFDDEHKNYRQWNVSSDIGEANRFGIPVLVVHGPSLRHSLKELDSRVEVVVDTLKQAVDVLAYVFTD
ncbi:YtoQ family protein [bacterium]|nr:hypothetical protein [Gemmatimonadota bacterium]MCH2663932.1 YtoQ family protein [bacterium]HCK08985.1 hypothetical protein [Candidatus Latescibacterota bacterium]